MTERMLTNRIRKLKALETQQKELEKQIEEVKAELKADMDSKGIEEQRCGDYVLRYATIVSNKFNAKLFKEERKSLYERYLKPSESRRFTVA